MKTTRLPRRELLIAYLAAAAACTHLIEAALPAFGPWFKPGLANTFTVVALYGLGLHAAVAVTIIRVLVSSLLMGTLLSPSFMMSLSGALGVVMAMSLFASLRNRAVLDSSAKVRAAAQREWTLGPIGASLLCSLAHIVMQLFAAWLIVIGHAGVWLLLPWLLIGAWLTGIINGFLAHAILTRTGFRLIAEVGR
ncbi:MAG: Gx transporter family protein [Magnetococcales bacterium]|nr:Gx transporter family protein [Magnetococcales bacterium]MBF0114822.1 Gx transporter family protein [Magnetococcales bacterium]